MVKQADMRKRHDYTILVARLDDIVITDGSAGLCDKFDPAFVCTLNVVAKGKESVRAQGNPSVARNPFLLLGSGERLRLLGKEVFPRAVAQNILILLKDKR